MTRFWIGCIIVAALGFGWLIDGALHTPGRRRMALMYLGYYCILLMVVFFV